MPPLLFFYYNSKIEHSIRMRTASSLPWGLSVQGVSVYGVSVHGVSVKGSLCPGGLCPGGSLSRGEPCPEGGLCLGESVWGRGSLSRGFSVRETHSLLWTESQTGAKTLPSLNFVIVLLQSFVSHLYLAQSKHIFWLNWCNMLTCILHHPTCVNISPFLCAPWVVQCMLNNALYNPWV